MLHRTNNDPFPEASILPPIPQSYYDRMNAVLDALPTERKTLRFPVKRRVVLLIAAAVALLTIGTALAVGIPLLRRMRDRTSEVVSGYQTMLNNDAVVVASGEPSETMHIPVAIGGADETGSWQPTILSVSDVDAAVGNTVIRLHTLEMLQNQRFLAILSVASDADELTLPESLCLSVDGGTPIGALSDMNPDRSDPHQLILDAQFPIAGNPLHADAVLCLTGKLNGADFTLRYVLTADSFEALRSQAQTDLGRYAAILTDIPGEAIPVDAYAYGYTVKEIARSGHWLYYAVSYDSADAVDGLNARKKGEIPFSEYDDGLWVVVDGMLNCFEVLSSAETSTPTGLRRITLYRSYFPYADSVPKESLVSINAAVFRVDWKAGNVSLPKDTAEYLAWRERSAELSAIDGQADYVAAPQAACDTFTFRTIAYRNRNGFLGTIGIILETPDPVTDAHIGKDRQPVVTVNGVELENHTLSPSEPDSYYGSFDQGGRRNGFLFFGPAFRTLPETVVVTVSWLGSEVTTVLHRSEFAAVPDYTDAVLAD